MLKYRNMPVAPHPAGCKCSLHDAGVIKTDPTGTGSIRSKYRSLTAMRWRSVRALTRQVLIDQDLLSLTAKGLLQIANPAIQFGSTKIQMFQRWFDYTLNAVVLGGDGSFLRPMIESAYADGLSFARKQVQRPIVVPNAQHKIDALLQLAVVELQGVIEAASQQAVRAVATGLVNNAKQGAILRQVFAVLQTIGVTRTNTMIELLVVKAFNEATLDVYAEAKIAKVGLVPEAIVARKIGDARKGPGSRVSRKVAPSRSTIGRITRAERALSRLNRVNVRTAGDDNVCPICEQISEDGPYTIDTARSLIPAHPHCRCTFVPADDARFASDNNGVTA